MYFSLSDLPCGKIKDLRKIVCALEFQLPRKSMKRMFREAIHQEEGSPGSREP